MVNIPKLKGKMTEKGFTQARLAKSINVSLSTIQQRFANRGMSFTIGEVELISIALELSIDEINEIFFAKRFA